MYKVTSTLPKTFDLETVLDRLDVGLNMHIKPGAHDACRQAVWSARDIDSQELRNWLSEQFDLEGITGAVRKDYAVSAWISYIQAEKAKKSGDTAGAWFHVSQARFHEGQVAADFAATERVDRLRSAGRKGGQTTGLNRSSLMRECIALLVKHRPHSGWNSHQHAFDTVCAELLDFSDRDGMQLTREDLLPKVIEWLSKHPAVRAAYQGESEQP